VTSPAHLGALPDRLRGAGRDGRDGGLADGHALVEDEAKLEIEATAVVPN